MSRITLEQIAKLAGVSPSTASLVFNDRAGVSSATRDRVWQVAVQHGYHKVKKKGGIIQFLQCAKSGDTVNSDHALFLLHYLEGMTRALKDDDPWKLGMTQLKINEPEQFMHALRNTNADGLIVLGTELTHEDVAMLKENLRIPFVVLDALYPRCNVNFINMDNHDSIYQAVEHLADQGYRSAGVIGSSTWVQNLQVRQDNYLRALQEKGLAIHFSLEFRPTSREVHREMLAFLQKKPRLPEVLCCVNDAIALGALTALHDCQYRVPEDVALMGFDDLAHHTRPQLTTIQVCNREMGFYALRRVIALLEENEENEELHSAPMKAEFSCSLLVRESTCRRRSLTTSL